MKPLTKELHADVTLKILKPAHAVFEAIVDPRLMSQYFVTTGSGRMEEGKTVTWSWADYGNVKADVKVQRIEPDKNISFVWSASGTGAPVEESFVDITLEAVTPNATRVKITEGGWAKDDAGIARLVEQTHGWVHFLCGLKVFLEHGINIRIGGF